LYSWPGPSCMENTIEVLYAPGSGLYTTSGSRASTMKRVTLSSLSCHGAEGKLKEQTGLWLGGPARGHLKGSQGQFITSEVDSRAVGSSNTQGGGL
jgi:hypothetical protein